MPDDGDRLPTPKLNGAGCILKASIVVMDNPAHGVDWDLWPLLPVLLLLDEVIADMRPRPDRRPRRHPAVSRRGGALDRWDGEQLDGVDTASRGGQQHVAVNSAVVV